MRNENMIHATAPDLKSVHLHLGAFSAIDQKQLFFVCHYLSRWVTVVHGKGRIITKYGYGEHNKRLIIVEQLPLNFFHLHDVHCFTQCERNVQQLQQLCLVQKGFHFRLDATDHKRMTVFIAVLLHVR